MLFVNEKLLAIGGKGSSPQIGIYMAIESCWMKKVGVLDRCECFKHNAKRHVEKLLAHLL